MSDDELTEKSCQCAAYTGRPIDKTEAFIAMVAKMEKLSEMRILTQFLIRDAGGTT